MEEEKLSKESIKTQLIQMGFELNRIDQALQLFHTKEEAVDYLVNYKQKVPVQQKMQENREEDFQDEEEDYKMIFVVRMDLKLALHKIAELVATAALKAYKQIEAQIQLDQIKEFAFYEWTEGGQRKIVVKANSEQDLLEVAEKAKAANINFVLIKELPSNLKFQKGPSPPSKKQNKKQNKAQVKGQPSAVSKAEQSSTNDKQKGEDMSVKNEMKDEKEVKKQEGKAEIAENQAQILVLGAFGPVSESQIDPITKHLKLL